MISEIKEEWIQRLLSGVYLPYRPTSSQKSRHILGCGKCARTPRGILYDIAVEAGAIRSQRIENPCGTIHLIRYYPPFNVKWLDSVVKEWCKLNSSKAFDTDAYRGWKKPVVFDSEREDSTYAYGHPYYVDDLPDHLNDFTTVAKLIEYSQ